MTNFVSWASGSASALPVERPPFATLSECRGRNHLVSELSCIVGHRAKFHRTQKYSGAYAPRLRNAWFIGSYGLYANILGHLSERRWWIVSCKCNGSALLSLGRPAIGLQCRLQELLGLTGPPERPTRIAPPRCRRVRFDPQLRSADKDRCRGWTERRHHRRRRSVAYSWVPGRGAIQASRRSAG